MHLTETRLYLTSSSPGQSTGTMRPPHAARYHVCSGTTNVCLFSCNSQPCIQTTACWLPISYFIFTWRDVVRGAHRLLHGLVLREVLGEAKVDELDPRRISRILHQPVLQLQVAVDNAMAVHVAHLPSTESEQADRNPRTPLLIRITEHGKTGMYAGHGRSERHRQKVQTGNDNMQLINIIPA